MRSNKPILLGLILGAIAAVAFTASASAQGFREEFHQTYPLSPGGQIALKNINGWVKITSWDRPEVKVDAVKHAGTRERLDEASIQVQADPSSIRIKTEYKDHNLTFTSDDPIHNPASVDYTLTVPANARLDAIKLINGELDIQNVTGDVTASCINGRLRASGLRGRTELSTVNGRLDVSYDTPLNVISGRSTSLDASRRAAEESSPGRGVPDTRRAWWGAREPGVGQETDSTSSLPKAGAQPLAAERNKDASAPDAKLKSVNGSVAVTLPSDANAEVTAKTVHGHISNDFGLPVDDGRYVGHSLAGRLGSGAARIELKNVNGSISLHRASDGKPLAPVTNLLQQKRETF